MNSPRWWLWLYPQWWRERYTQEFLTFLEDRPVQWRDVGDLLLHALDARFNPQLRPIGGACMSMPQRLRRAELRVFAALCAIFVAGTLFSGLFDAGPFATRMASNTQWGHLMTLALTVWEAGAVLAVLAVLVGGLPLLWSAWRQAPQVRLWLLVPLATVAAVVAPPVIELVAGGWAHQQSSNLFAVNTLPGQLYACWNILCAGVGVWAILRAFSASPLRENLIQFAYWPSVVATVAMGIIALGVVAWGIFATVDAPELFVNLNPLTGYATITAWLATLLALGVALAIATHALLDARTATTQAAPSSPLRP